MREPHHADKSAFDDYGEKRLREAPVNHFLETIRTPVRWEWRQKMRTDLKIANCKYIRKNYERKDIFFIVYKNIYHSIL